MKKSIVALLFLASACAPSSKEKQQEEEVVIEEGAVKPASTDTLYYIHTAGTRQQDTEAVKLFINGSSVQGKMIYLPAEKDWRFGILYGSKEGAFLNLTWTFIQEGIKDSSNVVFKLESDQLILQSYSSDADTGENIVDTSSAIKVYRKTDSAGFPKQDFDMGML